MMPTIYWIFIAGLVPMVIGALWYSPLLFEKSWMNASGMTPEKIKSGNMPVIFGVSYILSCFLAMTMYTLTVHQTDYFSVFKGAEDLANPELIESVKNFMAPHMDKFRTFGHGALHGVMIGLFLAMPIIAMKSLFERKNFKYIAIHTGYWVISLALMGGIMCGFAGGNISF